jgi:hypothetical protein
MTDDTHGVSLRRKRLWNAWAVLSLTLTILTAYPVSSTLSRFLLLLLWPACFALLLAALWNRKTVRWTGLSACALVGLFMVLPGREMPKDRLRNAYINELRAFEGTRYVWGGENGLGIDCSGLVRKAMIKAHLRMGLTTFNPCGARKALSLWWHDCSAKALRDGYRDLVRAIGETPGINVLDHAPLLPGDLAVTANGVHVLAYLGNNTWIEAEPSAGRTIVLAAPSDGHHWFKVPIRLLRWACLE